MNIDLLKKQHTMIRQLVSEIETQILAGDVVALAFDLSLKIGKLSGLLVLHLKSEDEYLYPSLMRSTNETIRRTAEEYNREMGTLAQEFMEYKRTYMLASNIKADSQMFTSKSQIVISAIKKRLDKEDRKLYPLV